MFLLPILIILAIIIVYQITKYMTVSMLMPINSVEIIKNFFSLTYVENRGAAFGTMMGGRWFFVALTVIVVVAGGIYYSKIYNKNESKIASLALVLVAGGAIGNCIDRLFRGYVVDMLSFNFFGYSFPVFNFADICVVIGAVLLVVSLCFTKEGK